MTSSTINRSQVEWVPINRVIPNPLNPRKNDAIKTEEMQDIILNRGWEEPLTVYKKNKNYIVLAGHRRLFAAKEANIKELPVFIVDPPENYQEEIERIASLQRGRVDWTPYEWAQFTYERWVAWGKPTVNSFAKKINLTPSTARSYIHVMGYFPKHEIDAGLQNGTFAISTLDELCSWMKALKEKKPDFVTDMGEDLIRQTMLKKIERKLAGREDLRITSLFDQIENDDLLNFLIDAKMKLRDFLDIHGIKERDRSTLGYMVSLGKLSNNLKKMDNNFSKEEAKRLVDSLEQTEKIIEQKKELQKLLDKE